MNLWELSDKELRKAAQQIKIENRDFPETMTKVSGWRNAGPTIAQGFQEGKLKEIWRSRYYLCQIHHVDENVERLSINCAVVDTYRRRWKDGLTWDELQQIKSEVGRGDRDALEFFPKDKDVVNVANIRHLWVFKKDLEFDFMWRAQ